MSKAHENFNNCECHPTRSNNHKFRDNLICLCGKDWHVHQVDPTPCPIKVHPSERNIYGDED